MLNSHGENRNFSSGFNSDVNPFLIQELMHAYVQDLFIADRVPVEMEIEVPYTLSVFKVHIQFTRRSSVVFNVNFKFATTFVNF